MFNFVKKQKYRRQEVWEKVVGKTKTISRNFQQSEYERINEELFAFINIGYKGLAGQIFPNKYHRLWPFFMLPLSIFRDKKPINSLD